MVQAGNGFHSHVKNCIIMKNIPRRLQHENHQAFFAGQRPVPAADGGTITGCTFNSGAVDISVSGQTGMVTISGNTYTPDKAENIGVLNADKGNLDIRDFNATVVWC